MAEVGGGGRTLCPHVQMLTCRGRSMQMEQLVSDRGCFGVTVSSCTMNLLVMGPQLCKDAKTMVHPFLRSLRGPVAFLRRWQACVLSAAVRHNQILALPVTRHAPTWNGRQDCTLSSLSEFRSRSSVSVSEALLWPSRASWSGGVRRGVLLGVGMPESLVSERPFLRSGDAMLASGLCRFEPLSAESATELAGVGLATKLL